MDNPREPPLSTGASSANTNRTFFLPRLRSEYYQGDAVVHWTLSISDRETGWLTGDFHGHFREIMLHAAARQALLCPVYCLLPDHIHLLWIGLRLDSDQRKAMKFLREYLAPHLVPARFQHQAHDHVLREEQRKRGLFARVCSYVLDNSRAAGLVAQAQDWPFAGAIIPGYPKMNPFDGRFWNLFWKIHSAMKMPDAHMITRPPIGL